MSLKRLIVALGGSEYMESAVAEACQIAEQRHSVRFQANYLAPRDAVHIAHSLGLPVLNASREVMDIEDGLPMHDLAHARVPRLTLLDSGAAVDASDAAELSGMLFFISL